MREDIIVAYFFSISLFAIGLTLYDKYASKRGLWRVREITLLLTAILGGSIAMLTVMKIIRHKTKHKKFMLGIPIIIIFQISAFILIKHYFI